MLPESSTSLGSNSSANEKVNTQPASTPVVGPSSPASKAILPGPAPNFFHQTLTNAFGKNKSAYCLEYYVQRTVKFPLPMLPDCIPDLPEEVSSAPPKSADGNRSFIHSPVPSETLSSSVHHRSSSMPSLAAAAESLSPEGGSSSRPRLQLPSDEGELLDELVDEMRSDVGGDDGIMYQTTKAFIPGMSVVVRICRILFLSF